MKLDLAVSLLLALIDQTARVSSLIRTAKAEGREELTEAEWSTILLADDAARAALVDAIEVAGQTDTPGD